MFNHANFTNYNEEDFVTPPKAKKSKTFGWMNGEDQEEEEEVHSKNSSIDEQMKYHPDSMGYFPDSAYASPKNTKSLKFKYIQNQFIELTQEQQDSTANPNMLFQNLFKKSTKIDQNQTENSNDLRVVLGITIFNKED